MNLNVIVAVATPLILLLLEIEQAEHDVTVLGVN